MHGHEPELFADLVALNQLENLQCAICLCIKRDAIITKCAHDFCERCLQSCIDQNGATCPLCRGDVSSKDSVVPDEQTRRIVLGLPVQCVKVQDCSWRGTLAELLQHIASVHQVDVAEVQGDVKEDALETRRVWWQRRREHAASELVKPWVWSNETRNTLRIAEVPSRLTNSEHGGQLVPSLERVQDTGNVIAFFHTWDARQKSYVRSLPLHVNGIAPFGLQSPMSMIGEKAASPSRVGNMFLKLQLDDADNIAVQQMIEWCASHMAQRPQVFFAEANKQLLPLSLVERKREILSRYGLQVLPSKHPHLFVLRIAQNPPHMQRPAHPAVAIYNLDEEPIYRPTKPDGNDPQIDSCTLVPRMQRCHTTCSMMGVQISAQDRWELITRCHTIAVEPKKRVFGRTFLTSGLTSHSTTRLVPAVVEGLEPTAKKQCS